MNDPTEEEQDDTDFSMRGYLAENEAPEMPSVEDHKSSDERQD